jgi:bis(5'-nucleosyl)-tetraphosphatase (symmetrical)
MPRSRRSGSPCRVSCSRDRLARYAIGDVQGCYAELRALLARVRFSADRDQLWFVGDLVNRGPQSLEVLRYVHALGDNAVVVLGNHDLHLLALAHDRRRKRRSSDTLDAIFDAADRDALLEWLLRQPLAHFDAARGDLMVHAGVVPQWTAAFTVELAGEVGAALARDARDLFERMYGDHPDRWSDDLRGMDRLRFAINALTRMRLCTDDGRIDLKMKGPPKEARLPYRPWFEHEARRTRDVRVIFGHWSALGLIQAHGVVGLDSGCVWGGSLAALDLDVEAPPVCEPCTRVSAHSSAQ